MRIAFRRSVLPVLASVLILASSSNLVAAEGESSFARATDTATRVGYASVDVALLRPLGALRLLVGTLVVLPMSSVINLIGLPISRDPAVFKEDVDRYVREPAEYLARPIGGDLAG